MTKNTDIELLMMFDNGTTNAKYYLGSIVNSLVPSSPEGSFDNIDVIDFDMLSQQMNNFMSYCVILKRFRKLKVLFDGKLSFYNPKLHNHPIGSPSSPSLQHACFVIDDNHQVFSLDDVEKFWNNRALL